MAGKQEWTLERILTEKKAVTTEVGLIIDPEYGEAVTAAKKVLSRAEMAVRGARTDDARAEAVINVEEAQAELELLHEDRDGKVIDFKFQGLNPAEYDKIVEANAPSAQQRANANKTGQTMMWNPETFPASLIAATLIEPKLAEDEIAQLIGSEQFNQAEIEALFAAALKSCTTAFRDAG